MNAELRRAVGALLPPGAKVLRDRGEGLYILSAPVKSDLFRVEPLENGLFRVRPSALLLLALEKNIPPETPLTRALARFRAQPADEIALSLFCEGVKLLEKSEPGRVARFAKAVRQRTAICLRENLPGGGLYALALILDRLEGIL